MRRATNLAAHSSEVAQLIRYLKKKRKLFRCFYDLTFFSQRKQATLTKSSQLYYENKTCSVAQLKQVTYGGSPNSVYSAYIIVKNEEPFKNVLFITYM
jgi:hypothetical protein